MTRKNVSFFEWWSWFKFNNLGLALGTNLKFYTSLSKGLKLKVRKFWGLIPTFVEVTGKKLVGGLIGPPILNTVNGKCSKWCTTNKDNIAGLELDSITTTEVYSQMIMKSTHFINESSSCIDLISSSNTISVKNWGCEMSIYERCHHNIIYGTLNFDIPLPPPYYRDVRYYKHANTENIQKVISTFDWSKSSSIEMQLKMRYSKWHFIKCF